MSILQVKPIHAGYEPLPGYVLEEAIGQGGFGEVWRCSAPGGLKKAAKFVFGAQDQSRASRELRSLERIKGVRHPFLLTLERFEVVNEQLVIITELAEESLEDVYHRQRKSGSCGIPRDVLLNYLHDAADGLDYLHRSYQLQHLDVKPGNLLMIGGHVKVADFGLLKDLREVECSVVGGLTPIYAPPEVFDGRPSMHSDQYSLAVMFQELLTGTRPFSGRTIAQLATQHVHNPPNLEPLPPADRVVVARALEKDPERRFRSCREFVDELAVSHRSKSNVAVDTATVVEEKSADVKNLPQLGEQANTKSGARICVVALGGTGAECVRELRRRVSDLRSASDIQLQSVLIDTDLTTIHSMRLAEVSDRVPKCNLIYTPLKPAIEYRNAGTDRLKTISRRWIYNVPRSGATEGMRPLGRLALVDHGTQVQSLLEKSIVQLAEQLPGQTDNIPPQVFLVGSLAGGTGSGMYIDVAHLLRHLMDHNGMADTKIISLLATAPLNTDPRNPLAIHDTEAAIKEIQHFMQAGNGYPGDEGADWPSVPAARTPLRDVYLIAGAADNRYTVRPAETIVEYIWASSNGCEDLLKEARMPALDDAAEKKTPLPGQSTKPMIRSMGVIPLGDSRRLEEQVLGPSLVRDLLKVWLGNPATARSHSPKYASRMCRRIGLSIGPIAEQLAQYIHRDSDDGGPFSTLDSDINSSAVHGADLVHGDAKGESKDSARLSLVTSIDLHEGQLDWMGASWINNLHREISVGLADQRLDLATAIEVLQRIHQSAAEITTEVCSSTDRERLLCMVAADQLEKFQSSIRQFSTRLEHFATIIAIAITDLGNRFRESEPWSSMPTDIRNKKDSLMLQLHGLSVNSMMVRPLNDHSSTIDALTLVETMMDHAVEIVTPVVQEAGRASSGESTVNGSNSGSSAMSSDGTHHLTAIESTYSRSGNDRSMEATQMLPPLEGTAKIEPMTLEEAVEMACPSLLRLGGAQRLILVVGNEIERGRLEPELRAIYQGPVTIALIPGADPILIHEAQQIELDLILDRMSVLSANPQVTNRLASRTDVKW